MSGDQGAGRRGGGGECSRLGVIASAGVLDSAFLDVAHL